METPMLPGTTFYLFFILIIIFYMIFKISELFVDQKVNKLPEDSSVDKRYIDIAHGDKILNFLDRIIKEKYTYHLYLTLMPIYLDRKIPEKKHIQELKEKIYVSVVGSLTSNVKKEVLRFFTEKGIEIYVHERIIILMNETDFRSTEKFTEAFRDLNPSKLDQILS